MAAYTPPTLAELVARFRTDIEGRTSGTALIVRSFERILSIAVPKITHTIHEHLAWVRDQILPDKCERTVLLRWARALGVKVISATYAKRTATFTATSGTPTIPVDSLVQLEDGTQYTVTTTVPYAPTMDVIITAVETGTDGNVLAGATVSLVNTIPGINSDGVISADTSNNVDAVDDEETEALRARVLRRLDTPPSGGGPGDYETWALEVAGVTRAWEFGARMGAGTVSLGFVRDDDVSPIPDAAEVAEVQAYIDSVKPIDVRAVYVTAPVAASRDITVLLDPNTAAVQTAVLAQLKQVFRDESGLEENGPAISKIDEAISTADGENDHQITLIGGVATASYDPDPGVWGINVLGTVTFGSM